MRASHELLILFTITWHQWPIFVWFVRVSFPVQKRSKLSSFLKPTLRCSTVHERLCHCTSFRTIKSSNSKVSNKRHFHICRYLYWMKVLFFMNELDFSSSFRPPGVAEQSLVTHSWHKEKLMNYFTKSRWSSVIDIDHQPLSLYTSYDLRIVSHN